MKKKKISTEINTLFFDFEKSRECIKTKDIDNNCEKLYKIDNVLSLNNNENINLLFCDKERINRKMQDEFVYRIDKKDDKYTISTGIYCGVLNFGKDLPQIEIKTGYSDILFKRMLNFSCGIFVDNFNQKGVEEDESIYSLLVQYLYLISLKKIANRLMPQRYVYIKKRGYAINGNIDINEYVNNDIISFDKKITYQFVERRYIQKIIDVLYSAMKCCQSSELQKLNSLTNFLSENYSGMKPLKRDIREIQNERILNNGLYCEFKKPLMYAKILLENNEINNGNNEKLGISGFLVDSSFLWEMYLYNLMKIHLKDWTVEYQNEISLYDNCFFNKKNYPDFVLINKNSGYVYILDAKFKKMNFDRTDVDNSDLQQIHSYSYYYHLKYNDKFKGAALIYPTKKDKCKNSTDKMYGLTFAKSSFAILTLKDVEKDEKITDTESNFIKDLENFLK